MAIIDKKIIGERILMLESLLKLNTRQFSKSINADPSYIGKVEKGEKSLSRTFIDAIIYVFDVNEVWLLTGEGSIFKNGINVPHVRPDAGEMPGTARIREKKTAELQRNMIGQIDTYLASKQEMTAGPAEDNIKNKLIASLERENERLQKDLNLSLGEIRHNLLLARAMQETTQELLVELLAKQRKMTWEDVAAEVGIKNGEKYLKLKEEGNFAYVGK